MLRFSLVLVKAWSAKDCLGRGSLVAQSPQHTVGCNTSSGLAIFSAVRSSQQNPARGWRMKIGFKKQSQPARHSAYSVCLTSSSGPGEFRLNRCCWHPHTSAGFPALPHSHQKGSPESTLEQQPNSDSLKIPWDFPKEYSCAQKVEGIPEKWLVYDFFSLYASSRDDPTCPTGLFFHQSFQKVIKFSFFYQHAPGSCFTYQHTPSQPKRHLSLQDMSQHWN